MNQADLEKLKILRNKFPIGTREAISLLKETNGNVEESEKLFKERVFQDVLTKTNAERDLVMEHLNKNNFDVEITLISLDKQLQRLTERILSGSADKEDAMAKIGNAIEQVEGLKRDFWLDLNQNALNRLDSTIVYFLTIVEWLDYEEYEGLDAAVSFHLNEVAEIIQVKLMLPEVADTLRRGREIAKQLPHPTEMKPETDVHRALTAELRKLENVFNTQRPLIVDAMYEMVRRDIGKFP